METSPKYLTVTDLNFYLSKKFKNDPYLHKVFLQGEVSNFRLRMNSTQYFSLKDEKSKINAVMYKSFFEKVKFKLVEGMKVYVSGYIDLYSPQGSYQFYVHTIEPAGLGALFEQLRQLREKLDKEGLFADSHKKKIPKFPDKIAVVTSASGAVIHDIMVTANRRFPHVEIDLFPTIVQGKDAAASIIASLQQIAASQDKYDVVIIGRGGGSLEDLWPFNEEMVVRQIYSMTMPVISSVGHETDTTLSDLVADKRAATPTAAAEYATPELSVITLQIIELRTHLYAAIRSIINSDKILFNRTKNSVFLREPQRFYDEKMQTLDLLEQKLEQVANNYLLNVKTKYQLVNQSLLSTNPHQIIKHHYQELIFKIQNLNKSMCYLINNNKNNFYNLSQKLDDNSPLKAISRGYVYTANEDGKTVTSVHQICENDILNLNFKDGLVKTRVLKIKGENHE
ncbi:MAG: exodeoxyribonuclease VII large subunit [Lactobacillus iners]|nr:exodeoxyribonuclease VII large subunit [Lactobacillus iners]MCT7752932.1 exodeoxyribonuclease VII large subunit [Lactobacillus iners]MCT7764796.1 exodeoxyribonuclease VII large subunit [Lactobacillus iners]MCT7838776.1 exodeoxyribonuclease VII large subunit [Lactobacillus iners]MCT7886429.1 exodeoxyribonuclease VII large subunit [Lactobacillus iners]